MLTALYILLVFLLVLANGFFVASEFALVGVRRSRILTLAKGGNRRARLLLERSCKRERCRAAWSRMPRAPLKSRSVVEAS
jgi:CBS domain containing-hemolysin-like protein